MEASKPKRRNNGKGKLFGNKEQTQSQAEINVDPVQEVNIQQQNELNTISHPQINEDHETQVIHETFVEVDQQSNMHAKVQSKNKAASSLEQQGELIVNMDTIPQQNALNETELNAETFVDQQSIPHAQTQTEQITQQKIVQESQVLDDPANELLADIESGTKKLKMEDQRIRRTYWLTPEEIKMVDQLVKWTGKNKYEVVGIAIQSMHKRASEAKKKK